MEENFEILGEYVYNSLEQRVTKEAGGLTTVFHYGFEGNIIGESDPGGTFTREYLYRGKNRLLMVNVASQAVYTYLNDRLGTPQANTDAEGNAVWEAIYRPFGEPRVHPMATLRNNFRFLGQYYDEETGLYYNWHRYYDPKIGRYWTPDPIGLGGGINLYAYVLNNPINSTDSKGLLSASAIISTAINVFQYTTFTKAGPHETIGRLVGGIAGGVLGSRLGSPLFGIVGGILGGELLGNAGAVLDGPVKKTLEQRLSEDPEFLHAYYENERFLAEIDEVLNDPKWEYWKAIDDSQNCP